MTAVGTAEGPDRAPAAPGTALPFAGRTIAVTCCHSRMGFNIVQSLAAAGAAIVALGREAKSMSRGSPGIIADHEYCDPFEDPETFVGQILTACQRHGATVLFPVHEEIYVIAEQRQRFEEQGITVVSPPFDRLISLHDKANLPAVARRAGIPFPATVLLSDREAIERAADEIGFPFIIKPRWGSGAMNIKRVTGPAELATLAAEMRANWAWSRHLAQEIVPGGGAGVGVLMAGGRPAAVGGHVRLRELPITGGTSSARVTLTDERLLRAGTRMVEAAGLADGICMVEFRYRPDSGEFWALEYNPRYWGGLSTGLISGVDFPALHLRHALNLTAPTEPRTFSRLAETRWLLGEIRAGFELIAARRWREAAAILRTRPGHRLYVEDFGPGRYGAFLREVQGYLRSMIQYGNFGHQSRAKEQYFSRFDDHSLLEEGVGP